MYCARCVCMSCLWKVYNAWEIRLQCMRVVDRYYQSNENPINQSQPPKFKAFSLIWYPTVCKCHAHKLDFLKSTCLLFVNLFYDIWFRTNNTRWPILGLFRFSQTRQFTNAAKWLECLFTYILLLFFCFMSSDCIHFDQKPSSTSWL